MDSGSGLVYEGKLVGIISHGMPECSGPLVFSNPVAAMKWINRNIL